MSRIGGAHRVHAPEQQNTNGEQKAIARVETSGNATIYRPNHDSHTDKFNAREGIERGKRSSGHARGHDNAHARGHHGKGKGDLIDIALEGVGDVRGVVIGETADTLIVLVEGEVHQIDKKSGKSRGHRKASEQEMRQGQEMQAQAQAQESQRQQEVQAQEQRSETVKEDIKVSNRKHDSRIAELKKEIKLDEAEAVERGTIKKIKREIAQHEQNKSVATHFQVYTPEVLHSTLSVSEVILGKAEDERFRNE